MGIDSYIKKEMIKMEKKDFVKQELIDFVKRMKKNTDDSTDKHLCDHLIWNIKNLKK